MLIMLFLLEGGDLIKIAQLGEINMRAAIAVDLHVWWMNQSRSSVRGKPDVSLGSSSR
jgi:hypothetical protein